MKGTGPIRVLHTVGSLQRGGIETWLNHVMHNIDTDRFDVDIFVRSSEKGGYREELEDLGCEIMTCVPAGSPIRLARAFKDALTEHGPYDILHTDNYYEGGLLLYLGCKDGIPVRIVHSHNSDLRPERKRLITYPWRHLSRLLMDRYATNILAVSKRAARQLLGERILSDPRYQTLTVSIDLEPFGEPVDGVTLRKSLEIPTEAFVVGHVGRFSHQKNHEFLIRTAKRVIYRLDAYLLLVGGGAERPMIEALTKSLGIADRVIFAGVRSDVPALMKGVMDLFCFPSRSEGLGLVVVEAQAAGVPCLMSSVVPEEVEVVSPLIKRMPLSAGHEAWADVVCDMIQRSRPISASEALAKVHDSPFNVVRNAEELMEFYEKEFATAAR